VNAFLPERYDEYAQRLALGLELVDAERGGRVAHPVAAALDGVPYPLPPDREPYPFGGTEVRDLLSRVDRHDSGLFALVYRKGLYQAPKPPETQAFVTLRFTSPERRFIPRRLRFPLLDPATVAQADEAKPVAGDPALLGAVRIRRVALFPGATYDVPSTITGLRGRCRRANGDPVRWVRVEAWTHDGAGERVDLVGRAQGDDRGEFLLLLGSGASGVGPLDLAHGLSLVLDVRAPPSPPAVPLEVQAADPLWDLPVETVTGSAPEDPVSLGEAAVPGAFLVSRSQSFDLGRCMTSDVPPFQFP
jgi:hypothetical protein